MAILIVDPCVEYRQLAIDIIKWADGRRTVDVAENGANAMSVALDSRPDLVFCEPALPDMPGEALCQRLREQLPKSLFVAYTNDDPGDFGSDTFDGILCKPPSRLAILPHLHAVQKLRQKLAASNAPQSAIATQEARNPLWRRTSDLQERPWKILVRLADENTLKFMLPVPRCATVAVVLQQLGKQRISSYTLYRNNAALPTVLDTHISDGDELRIHT